MGRFVEKLPKGSTIISFNWDVLIDDALYVTKKWDYEDGYKLVFKDTLYKFSPQKNREKKTSEFLLLKPHGSINWYESVSGKDLGLFLMVPAKPSARAANPFQTFLNYSEYSDDNKIGKEEAEIRQKILPPGEAKFVAPEVLAAMKVALKNARQITIIGFSFNQNDPHIWHEFSGIEYRNDLNINIIDPDFESVRQICEQIFRTKNIIKAASSLREYCESQSM